MPPDAKGCIGCLIAVGLNSIAINQQKTNIGFILHQSSKLKLHLIGRTLHLWTICSWFSNRTNMAGFL